MMETVQKAIPLHDPSTRIRNEWIRPRTWRVLKAKAQHRQMRKSNVVADQQHYQCMKKCSTKLLNDDCRCRMETILDTVEKLLDNNPKCSLQILSCWYKRSSGVNLPLA